MLLDLKADMSVKEQAFRSLTKYREEMFAEYREVDEGRRGGKRQGFIGRRKWERDIVMRQLTRPAIGRLQLFHHIHVHASRHRVECIATFGSFVEQYRGVLTNRKRRLLGRAPSWRPTLMTP